VLLTQLSPRRDRQPPQLPGSNILSTLPLTPRRLTLAHQEHRVPIAFFPKAEALTPGFVTIVDRLERVHLQNLLKGELTDNVAKIRRCSQW
jgi:hypothetical protein